MGPTLGGQGHPGRCPHDYESAPVVDAVDKCIEPAQDERVVDGADRQQRLSEVLVGQPELAQQHEQVHLRDAELDVLAVRARLPAEQGVLGRIVGGVFGREDAGLVDPAAEAGRDRDIGARCHDPPRDVVVVGQPGEDAPKGLLGRAGSRLHDCQAQRARRGRDDQVRSGPRRGVVDLGADFGHEATLW